VAAITFVGQNRPDVAVEVDFRGGLFLGEDPCRLSDQAAGSEDGQRSARAHGTGHSAYLPVAVTIRHSKSGEKRQQVEFWRGGRIWITPRRARLGVVNARPRAVAASMRTAHLASSRETARAQRPVPPTRRQHRLVTDL
jgi:hypothetical protein